MLFTDANAQLGVNNSLSNPFPLERSIRQGCPLSPFLYVLAVDALGYLLQKYNHMGLIKGIAIPNNSVVINSHFADDNLLFVQNYESEINNVMEVLELYCAVSGSRLAHHKTEFLMIQPDPVPPWIPNQWKLIKHGQITRYLGIPFGLEFSLRDVWDWFLTKLKNKIFSWGNRYISLAGKIQVINRIF